MKNSTVLSICVFVFVVGWSGSAVGKTEVSRKSLPDTKHVKTANAVHKTKAATTTTAAATVVGNTDTKNSNGNETCVNGTNCSTGPDKTGYFNNIMKKITENKAMLLRTMYVLIGVTGIVVLYFVMRAWRLRSRRRKARKYGIITTPASDLEMAPLGQGDDDDDDDDMTVFELNGKRRK